jgi:formylglycine-generating enzyme required for sulfatase activity
MTRLNDLNQHITKENFMTELQLNFVKIPASDFTMGSKRSLDIEAHDDELPAHVLHVSDYFIMKYPVTNAQYYQFMQATGYRAPLFWKDGAYPTEKANHPVVGVALQDALAFCAWAGQVTGLPVRLPTEPEWEKAARGPQIRVFPWGDEWKNGLCNIREEKINGTTPVDQFSPQGDSPYGIADMGGNVQEWCSSLFGSYPYDPADGREEYVYILEESDLMPKIWGTGTTSLIESAEASTGKAVIRGGSWRESKFQARCAYRGWAAPMHRSEDTGFRCCYEPKE